MVQEILAPLTDEQSKAIQESAKFGVTALETVQKAGKYAADVVANIPQNLVGLVFGDWLTHKRLRRLDALQRETARILRERDVQEQAEPSPSVALPLLTAAIDEERETLRTMWAKLLASAMDPKRVHLVRNSFMEILKQLDPLDAELLTKLWYEPVPYPNNDTWQQLHKRHGRTVDDIQVAYENLRRLGLVAETDPFRLSATGRAFLAAVG